MRVTIISDASHCHMHNVGGYGFWAVSQRGHYAGSGAFKGTAPEASAFEAMAIVNALHCALARGVAADGDAVLFQTDSKNAIGFLTGEIRVRDRNKYMAAPVQAFLDLVTKHRLAVDFRHVKGHSQVQDNRSKAQRKSDKRARDGLKLARAKVAKAGVT